MEGIEDTFFGHKIDTVMSSTFSSIKEYLLFSCYKLNLAGSSQYNLV